jgi:hypothetical protein
MSKTWAFDIYDSIRAVNWIRKEVAKNRSCTDDKELIRKLRAPFEAAERPAFLKDDAYLQPYLPDDALLPALSCESWNEDRETDDSMKCEDAQSASGAGLNTASSNGKKSGNEIDTLKAENQILREKLERQEALIEAVKLLSMGSFNFSDSHQIVQAKCSILDGADTVRSEGAFCKNPPWSICALSKSISY